MLATHNAHKLAELRRLLAATSPAVRVLGLDDVEPYPEPAETERSFEGNALLKARACTDVTRLPALADDSGLAVDVLNGMAGVRSARWAGPGASDADNNALLLRQLDDVPAHLRTAHFACAVALVLPDGRERTTTGRMDGRLLRAPVGQNGFGYDPLFWVPERSCSSADLAPVDKNQLSHRARAMALLKQRLGIA